MKTVIFTILILLQIITIGIVSFGIYKKNKVLGITNINPIKSDTIVSKKTDILNYFYEPMPDAVIKPEPIFEGLENVSYKINIDGLNQVENYTEKKHKNTYRIITLGDSFTFGANVNTEENYPSQLNRLLTTKVSCLKSNKIEVINLGVVGYDIQYAIERLKLRGIKYDPDLVIWLLVPDDFRRILELLHPRSLEYERQLRASGEYQKQTSEGNYYIPWKKAQEEIIKELRGEKNILSLQKSFMERINNFYSGKLLIVFSPVMPNNYREIIASFSKERKNTIIYDNLPNLYLLPGTTLPDAHPNKKGHEIIAKSIRDYLIGQKIIPCKLK